VDFTIRHIIIGKNGLDYRTAIQKKWEVEKKIATPQQRRVAILLKQRIVGFIVEAYIQSVILDLKYF
jgi:hypothetical protein